MGGGKRGVFSGFGHFFRECFEVSGFFPFPRSLAFRVSLLVLRRGEG